MTYEITISGTPRTWNAFINKSHWAYYAYKQTIFKQVSVAIHNHNRQQGKWIGFMRPVRIGFVLGFVNARTSDIDSICIKPHVDALVQGEIIEDDNKEIVREVRTTWEKSKEPFTKIIIETL